ncbi:MAG: Spo0B domain-containing protein [Peptococcaceae bacterium]|nr:Spo0B domain-containing protein [Peptococcaceae bacterium]
MRFIRTYGHDFLNHLQVISGYAQLHHTDRIREYINKITGQIKQVNEITRIANPQIATVFLVLQQDAFRYGVPLVFKVRGDLAGVSLDGEQAGKALAYLVREIKEVLEYMEGTDEAVDISVTCLENHFVLRIKLPLDLDEIAEDNACSLMELDRYFKQYAASFDISKSVGRTTISVQILCREE